MCADFLALMASDAEGLVNAWLTCSVLLHLSGTRTTAHAEIFHCATKACLLMALKVREADDDIGIHESTADFGILDVFSANNGNFYLI